LYEAGKIKKLLVVCPKSIVGVWEAELNKFADFEYNAAALSGDSIKKADILRHMNGKGLQIAIVNYESAWRLETEITKWKPDFIVCDESSKIKNPQAKQARALHNLGRIAKYKAILTGTPITNSPLDFFSQYKFLDEKVFGTSYFRFRARYATLGGYGNHQIVGYKNMSELVTKAHSIAYRIKIEDAVELPDKIDDIRLIQLERNAQNIYRNIDEDSYSELMQGEVTTRNVLTRLLRLSQCTGGFIRDDENGIVQEVSRAKLDALEDILDECGEAGKKVVVFARFVPEIEAIERLLKIRKTGYAIIHGGIADRAEQVSKFQTDPECKVFIGQLQTTGMGLTLTAANVAVFYSLDFSYANYEQSRARIHRIGQTQKCLYIHLVAKGTVDEKVMEALRRKSDIARLMVDDYRKLTGGKG
jgi:SNF2 family DNA or RNA helicase